ncbi:MAG: response regulator transcription factor [Opitutales bacterium]|nr:response regulator transcription factor [Opitutales bacterium]
MNSPHCNIILVEDDADLRESTGELLRREGYAVTAVGSGLEFYQEVSVRTYRVALVDLGLPDQAGEVLVDYLRRNTRTAVIVITARDTIDTRVAIYRLGADLFMGKPIDRDELLAAISSLVGRQNNDPEVNPGVMAPSPAAKEARTWRLVTAGRILITPDGVSIELTGNEFDFLGCLGKRRGAVGRKEILACVKIQPGEGAQRALEELVRRIRRKLSEATQQPPPILTHYGLGYLFADHINIVG